MALYGHTGTVNCLDLHGDRLVSGSKDRLVKGQQSSKVHVCDGKSLTPAVTKSHVETLQADGRIVSM